MARLTVDQIRCTGLGVCEGYAEHIFEIQANGSLQLLVTEIDESDLEVVRQAVESCPTEALRLEE